ncbi:MAG TPA: response regulator [Spirochaetota bacterium]|nr:response regulator [Spirochaetota bacterium]HPF05592.1 response regulator [Spirochaetota bacterium]HPJ43556.1 response regulator [Spirochaetota bacterium]HPR36536.1 response regulator [Spirochaetota bacterium]HRX47035.1 response regulator [Spirochaetota bacterium]
MAKLKILVADDDYDILTTTYIMLKSKGYDVVTAGSGEEAIVKYNDFHPDVILLDLMMENFNSGVTVCKKIRETDKKVKIFLISAVSDETSGQPAAQELGFSGTMTKPINPEKLLKLIDN